MLQQKVDEKFSAISELRTALKKMDVKVGLAQHAGDTAADKFALMKQSMDEKCCNADAKIKRTVQRLQAAQIGSAGAIEAKLISMCEQLVRKLQERMVICLGMHQEIKGPKAKGKKGVG